METMNIDKICRACLSEDEKIIDMYEENVYRKFLLSTNLIYEEEIPNIPFNLCRSCEQKLNASSSDFKEECRKSHEILLSYVRNARTVKSEANDADAKKSSRLVQFPRDEVWETIRELKQRFYENTSCIRCSYVGCNTKALAVHVSQAHKYLKLRWCSFCNAEFDNLTDHITTNHDDDFICKFCRKKFQGVGHLTDHLRSHSDVKPFSCSFCDKCFNRRSYLKAHLNEHTKEKVYKCEPCNKSFTKLSRLRDHLKVHEGQGHAQPFIARQNFCVECNKSVRSLAAHTKKLHTDSVFLCEVCEKQFGTAFKLRIHIQAAHTTEASYECRYCDKKLKTRGILLKHERTHTGEKPYVCQVCGKSFAQSDNLKTHLMIHNIGPKISCEKCDKKFPSTSKLRLHLQTHSGEKPYVCTECGKGFVHRTNLIQHSKTHSDLRSFECSHCDKAFKHNASLKHHMLIHSGEKPYKCSQCSYACRHSSSLTKHMKQHIVDNPRPDRPHVCLMCGSTFTTDAMLTSHINTHNVSFLEI